jgi:hypothetical protein
MYIRLVVGNKNYINLIANNNSCGFGSLFDSSITKNYNKIYSDIDERAPNKTKQNVENLNTI